MADNFTVYNSALQVHADGHNWRKIINTGGGSFYYKSTNAVSTSDTAVASGSSVIVSSDTWIITAAGAPATVIVLAVPSDGSYPQAPAHNITPGHPVSGTDTACTSNTIYVTEFYIGTDFFATGLGYQIGSVGGTDKVVSTLFDSSGAPLANSATAGATVGTAATVQKVDFTAPFAIKGGQKYQAGVVFNGTTAKFRSIPAGASAGVFAGTGTQTFGTVAAITPVTTFTADKGPYCFLY